MASINRQQLRLSQISGSFKDREGAIIDTRAAGSATLASITLQSGSMVGIMSEVISAIKRINGGGSFASMAAGVFGATLKSDTDSTDDLGADGTAWRKLYVDDIDLNGQGRIDLNDDADTSMRASSSNVITFEIGGTDELNLSATALSPEADAGLDLGTTALGFNDLHLGSGGVVNFDGGDVTATHSANLLTITGGNTRVDRLEVDSASDYLDVATNLRVVAAADIELRAAGGQVYITGSLVPEADATRDLGTTSAGFNDLHLGSGGVINFNNGNYSITHAANKLTLGANSSDQTVITGDLVVQGSTTTVSSSNTLFQDSIIGLGVSGSEAGDWNNVGDRAVIFARGANSSAYLPAVNYGSDGVFEIATFSASPSSSSMGNPVAGIDLKVGGVLPVTSNGHALGSTSLQWSDLFLAEGAVINFDNGDFTMTQTNNLLALAGGNTRVDRLELDSASDYLDVDTDLQIVSNAKTIINAGGNIDLDVAAATNKLSFQIAGTELGFLMPSGSSNGSNTLLLSSSADKNISFDANGGSVFFTSDGTQTGGNALQISMATNNVASIKDAAGNGHYLDFDLSADNMTVHGTSRLQFNDSGTYIYSNADGDLDLISDGTEKDSIKLDSAGGITLDGDNANLGVVIADNGTEIFKITYNNSDASLESAVSDKDIIFKVNDGGTPGEVARFDGSDSRLAMARSNAGGTSAGIICFDGIATAHEAIYGDGSYLYLRSNNVSFRMPNSDGDDGQLLKTNGSAQLSWVDAGAANLKKVMFITGSSGIASGSEIDPAAEPVSNTAPSERAALDLSGIAGDSLGKVCDVFVNGQMMISGSNANVGSGTADYYFTAHTATSKLKFGFDLEEDDVLTVVVR